MENPFPERSKGVGESLPERVNEDLSRRINESLQLSDPLVSTSFKSLIPERNPVSKLSIADISKYSPDVLCLYTQRGNALDGRSRDYQLLGKWADLKILEYEAIKKRTIIVPSQLVRREVTIVDNDRELGYPDITNLSLKDGPYQVVAILDVPGEDINIGASLLKIIDLLEVKDNNVKETLGTIKGLDILGLLLEPSSLKILANLRRELYVSDLRKPAPIIMIYYRIGYYLLVYRSTTDKDIYAVNTTEAIVPRGSASKNVLDNVIVPGVKSRAIPYEKLSDYMEARGKDSHILRSISTMPMLEAGTSSMDSFDYTQLDGIFDLGKYFNDSDFLKIFIDALLSQGGWRLLKIGDISQIKVIGEVSYDYLNKILVNASQQEMLDVVTTFLPRLVDPPEVPYIPATIDVNVSWFFSLKSIANALTHMSKKSDARGTYIDEGQFKEQMNTLIDLDVKSKRGPSRFKKIVSFNEKLGAYVPLQNINWENTYIKGAIIYYSIYGPYLDMKFYYVESLDSTTFPSAYDRTVPRDFDDRSINDNEGASNISRVNITGDGNLAVTWSSSAAGISDPQGSIGSYAKIPYPRRETTFLEKFKVFKKNPITIIIDCRDDNGVEDLELFQGQAGIYYTDIQAKYPNVKAEILQDDNGLVQGYYVSNPIVIIGNVESINLPDFYILKGTANDVLVDDLPMARCGYGLFEDGQEKPHVFGTASFMSAIFSLLIRGSTEVLNSYVLDPDNFLETLKQTDDGTETDQYGIFTNYTPIRRLKAIYNYI